VVIFPEGTSTCGERVLPFRSALLAGAAADGTGVHYATLAYAVADDLPDASLAVAWTGSQSLIPHLWRLLCLPAFEARLVFGPDALRDSNRRTLAARLHARVADQHRRIVSAQRPWEAAPARVG
jgi:1-acyl-sn-glycerol-3-phosphate acyltransferase